MEGSNHDVIYTQILMPYFPERTEKNRENFSHDS
jgi:hypothetical protein